MKHHETLEHSSFDVTISVLDVETSALDVETSAFGAATKVIARRSFDVTISAFDAETSAIARSYQRYRRLRYRDIGDTLRRCVTELLIKEIWGLFPDLSHQQRLHNNGLEPDLKKKKLMNDYYIYS